MSLAVRRSSLLALSSVVLLAAVVTIALSCNRHPPDQARGPETKPATLPDTRPETKPAKPPEPKYARTFMDVVREAYPAFPATQPLAVPLNLPEAARLVLKDPVCFDSDGAFLWITRPDAPPTDQLLKARPEDPERIVVTRERVLYAHWMMDETGGWRPYLVTPVAGGDGATPGSAGWELVCHLGRRKIGSRSDYRWDRAWSWNDKIVVPTATGVSIFRFAADAAGRSVDGPPGPAPVEDYLDLVSPAATTRPSAGPSTQPADAPPAVAGASGNFAEPQALLDTQGLLAWIPWDPGKQGGRGAARYLDGKWSVVGPDTGWPEKVLHLVPLLDGSVIQFVLTPPGEAEGADDAGPAATGAAAAGATAAGVDPHVWPVRLSVTNLEHVQVDEKRVRTLVAQLAAGEPSARDDAYNELTRYGAGIWPILKNLYEDAAPEAQARIKQLLRKEAAPLLGGMLLLGDRLQLVCRNRDGSAVFYSEKGVQSSNGDGEPVVRAPAWLAVRPGHPVQLLDPRIVQDLRPDRAKITPVGDEWLVTGDVRGPRRFIGNSFVNLLRRDEVAFADFVGVDHRGRWVFRPPPPGLVRRIVEQAPSAGPSEGSGAGSSDRPAAGPASGPSTGPAAGAISRAAAAGETLILDPTLPNLIPRLPVWTYTTADEAGWDKDNWPTVRQLNHLARLKDGSWEILPEGATLFTRADQAPPVPGPPAPPAAAGAAAPPPVIAPTTRAAPANSARPGPTSAESRPAPETAPETAPAGPETRPATAPAGPPATAEAPAASEALLWEDRDGTRYYNGTDQLRVVGPDGRETTWTLPASAAGVTPVRMVKTADGRLFLFNQPGRVARIKPTPGEAEPFAVEATFTRDVPNPDSPARIWLDPAGRIIVAWENKLAILFPSGYVPPAIRGLMSDTGEEDDE